MYDTPSGATFSACEKYRYLLWRRWSDDLPPLVVCLLNPSTADAVKNDPTVERCERRARAMGRGGLVVTNLFAYRATDPAEMKRQDNPVGPENDASIVAASAVAGEVYCGWGTHGNFRNRAACVQFLLRSVPIYAFKRTKAGLPQHPLYVSYDEPIVPMNQLARNLKPEAVA